MKSFSGVPRSNLRLDQSPAAKLELKGKRVAVIGGTGGIGRALARLLASHSAAVTVVGQTFRDEGVAGLTFIKADLNLMSEARRVAQSLSVEQLDVLVLTNGIIAAPKREVTAEGIERDLAVSYLSRLALVREVAPRLGKARPPGSPKPRIFVMGFPGTGQKGDPADLNAEKSYEAMETHMNTVAGNEALVLDGARRYPEVNFFGLNPGLIKTNIRSNVLGGEGSLKHRVVEGLIGLVTISAETYAARIAPLLLSPSLEGHSGAMFNQKAIPILASDVMTADHVGALISASEVLLAGVATQS